MVTNKTLLVVTSSKIKREIDFLSKLLKDNLTSDQFTIVISYLTKDVGVLANLFNLSDKDEFEMLICLGATAEMINQSGGEGVSSIKLISNWSSFQAANKANLLDIVKKNIHKSDYFYSLQYLNELNIKNAYKETSNFLEFLAKSVTEADSIVTETEKNRLKIFNDFISNSNLDIEKRTTNEIVKLFADNKLEINSENKIVLNTIMDLKKLVSSNQKSIVDFGQDKVQHLIQAISYLNTLEKDIRETENKLHKADNIDMISVWFEILYGQIRSYNYIYLMITQQVGYAIESDHFNFYELYQLMESMGMFVTTAEKQTMELLKDINKGQATISGQLGQISSQLSSIDSGINKLNQNVISLTNSVMSLEGTLKDGFSQVSYGLSEMTNAIGAGMNNISTKLDSIDSSIQYNNLVTTVNAYQNYKINQKVGKLLIE